MRPGGTSLRERVTESEMRAKPTKRPISGLPQPLLVALFLLLALSPLAAALASGLDAAGAFNELATALGFTSAALILLQFLSSGRYEALSGRVGLDRTMGFHRIAAYALLCFALLHPLGYVAATALADPDAAWSRLTHMLTSSRLRTGVLALAGLALLVGLGALREKLKWRYESWRASHGLMASAVAVLVLHHAATVGAYSGEQAVQLIWAAGATMAFAALAHVYFVRPWRMWARGWTVESVEPAGARTWQITLQSPHGHEFFFRAGQFVWLTIAPHSPPFHDHPFSIASAPAELPRLRLIVREAGDCTNAFGQLAAGLRAAVDGPHGSFVLQPGGTRIVMIAGGVGIAPLLGMLEEAASETDTRAFHLVYAARTPEDLTGLERLRDLRSKLELTFDLIVDHDGGANATFSEGPLQAAHIAVALGSTPQDVAAYVCGPPPMMEQVTDTLLDQGVSAKAIHYERFDYGAGSSRLDRARRRQALAVLAMLVAGMGLFAFR